MKRALISLAFAALSLAPLSAERPLFVSEVFQSQAIGNVEQVLAWSEADVVQVTGGHEAGFRLGMVCEVSRGRELIAELVLVEVRPKRSAALIINLKPGTVIGKGDTVTIKSVRA